LGFQIRLINGKTTFFGSGYAGLLSVVYMVDAHAVAHSGETR
jgi:hypothetical protein